MQDTTTYKLKVTQLECPTNFSNRLQERHVIIAVRDEFACAEPFALQLSSIEADTDTSFSQR